MRSAPVRLAACWFVLLCGLPGWAKEARDDGAGVELEDVTILPPLQVNGARMEDLGIRFNSQIVVIPAFKSMLTVAQIFPNTAAAKAGLRPGEQILKIDGKSVGLATILSLGYKPDKLEKRMWAELGRGKKSVSITMEVRAPKAEESRTVTLTLPSPPPRWGSKQWSPPEGRTLAVVWEPGPLAALAREVLDHGIWSERYDRSGYEWRIVQPSGSHRIWVTQQNGKTEISLEHRSVAAGRSEFTTSPSGAMETGRCTPPKEQKRKEVPPEELRAQFEAEIDFWLHKVGRVTGRWPFEALSGETAVITSAGSPMRTLVSPNAASSATGKVNPPFAESFLKLPVATAEQKLLFSDALGKIGLDADCWAFTETARTLDDDHATTVRFDPSQPPEASSTLLKVDGKAPKAAYLQKWRDEGREALPGLGDLPPLSSVVDLNDVRIFADETASVVFELPVKDSNSDFPADKFQARFRVNKTHRGFEDFSVKLREPMRMAGIAKMTEAGLEARFQTFDPTLAPQPVFLKMGGGVRLLLVKISRAFEVTRTDFARVIPFDEPGPPAL